MTYLQGSTGDADTENRLITWCGEEEEGGIYRESNMETYTLPYVKYIASRNLLYDSGNSNWGSINNLEGWDVEGGGKEFQEGRDIVYL